MGFMDANRLDTQNRSLEIRLCKLNLEIACSIEGHR